ncbi:hypothetical protein ACFLY2_00275 [Patescibacteria group bacterium]
MKKILATLLVCVTVFSFNLFGDEAIIIDEETYLKQVRMVVNKENFPATESFLTGDFKNIVFNTNKLKPLTMDMCRFSFNMASLIEKDAVRPYKLEDYRNELRDIYKAFFKDMYVFYKFDITVMDNFLIALNSDINAINVVIRRNKR